MICHACGTGTPAGAHFCPACGQPLAGGVDERRVVTVLFADLVDSTSLVTSLDPEAARDVLNETFRRLAAEVRRFGGTLEKYVGDAILAVFGFPTGHDDDAARAVRAALAMRDIVKTAETALGDLPLHLRIGLDTGEVAAGPWPGDLQVTGPPVHTAARVQQAAEPDQILLGDRLAATAGPGSARELAAPLAGVREEAAALAADARAVGRRSAEASAQVTLGDVALLAGDPDAAERHYAAGNRLSKEIGYTRKRLWSLLGLVQVAVTRAEPATARRLATEAIELTTQPDGSADVEAELHLAEACLAGADPEGAAAALARDWAVLQEADVFSRARLQRTQARLAAAGDPAAAVALLERSLAGLEATGHRLEQLQSLADLAPALRRAGRAEEADAAAKRVLTDATAMGAHALVQRLTRQEGDGR